MLYLVNSQYFYNNNSKNISTGNSRMTEELSSHQNPIINVDKNSETDATVKQLPKALITKRQYPQDMEIENIDGNIKEESSQGNVSGSKKQWTIEQDDLVFKLHNEYGNKWALIAQRLKGRTDNCIKNHFYSRLRKGLRKINKLIQDEYKQNYKEFKIIDLYKVIQASDEKFKQVNAYPSEMTDFGHDLKNRIFIYAEQESDATHQFAVMEKKLLDDLNQFAKNYKRKSKKSRRYSPMGVGSVYRNISKKSAPIIENQQQNQLPIKQNQPQPQPQQQPQRQEVKIDKIESQIKSQLQTQQKDKRLRPKREKPKTTENNSKQLTLVSVTKQLIPLQFIIEEQSPIRTKKGNTYRQFSDDQGEEKDDAEYQREQRLNHFAENILKTFKSYYSFKSFKSNSAMQDPFFQ